MEKFGIFQVLSALAGLSETQTPPPAADSEPAAPESAPPTATNPGLFTDTERLRRAEQMLARHDEISRRIDRNKK